MNSLNEYFISSVDYIIAAATRVLSEGNFTKMELAFMRLQLREFQRNIKEDFRFNEIVKFRVSLLNLDFCEPCRLTVFEKFASFFIKIETLRNISNRKIIRSLIFNLREQLHSLRVLAFNYDLSCSIDRLTARYLTLAPM